MNLKKFQLRTLHRIIRFKMWDLKFELVSVENELPQHCWGQSALFVANTQSSPSLPEDERTNCVFECSNRVFNNFKCDLASITTLSLSTKFSRDPGKKRRLRQNNHYVCNKMTSTVVILLNETETMLTHVKTTQAQNSITVNINYIDCIRNHILRYKIASLVES